MRLLPAASCLVTRANRLSVEGTEPQTDTPGAQVATRLYDVATRSWAGSALFEVEGHADGLG